MRSLLLASAAFAAVSVHAPVAMAQEAGRNLLAPDYRWQPPTMPVKVRSFVD